MEAVSGVMEGGVGARGTWAKDSRWDLELAVAQVQCLASLRPSW